MCVASNYLLLGFVYCCWVPGVSMELYGFGESLYYTDWLWSSSVRQKPWASAGLEGAKGRYEQRCWTRSAGGEACPGATTCEQPTVKAKIQVPQLLTILYEICGIVLVLVR
ncbi:hypothetical protein BDL97_19G030300 [Sphagnum fallax]|nr:hypothetical protein BDL97_19G030300 [Sphagnum fallax]